MTYFDDVERVDYLLGECDRKQAEMTAIFQILDEDMKTFFSWFFHIFRVHKNMKKVDELIAEVDVMLDEIRSIGL